MTEAVAAVFGVPAYNHAHKLRESLESLLLQTRRDLRVIVSDDNSSDDTAAIVQEYAGRDPRVVYRRTEQRLGYIGNARRCFELARELFPQARYFAWASDHDLWHPNWLATLIDALERHPEAVLACSRVFRMHADGSIMRAFFEEMSTTGITDLRKRFVTTFNEISAGNMIYGLFKADALERAGILRWHLLPDRLLLMELSLYGTMITVPQHLWYRRYHGIASIARQRRASFFDGTPAYLWLPWWLAHSGFLFRDLAIRTRPELKLSRTQGAGYALLYGVLGAKLAFKRWTRRKVGLMLGLAARIVRPPAEALRRLARSIPGTPYRVLRPLYVPLLAIVFRRRKS